MTVSTDISRVQYTAPGGSNDYGVNFPFFEDSDLVVLVTVGGVDTTMTLGADYTVTGGDNDVGTVTGNFTTGATVTIYRDLPYEQPYQFENGDDLDTDNLNDLADKLVMMMQQILAYVGRAIVLSPSSTLTGLTFPSLVGAAAKFLRVNATEDGYEHADVADLGAVGLPLAASQGGTGLTSLSGLWAAIFTKATAATVKAATNDTTAVTPLAMAQVTRTSKLARFQLCR